MQEKMKESLKKHANAKIQSTSSGEEDESDHEGKKPTVLDLNKPSDPIEQLTVVKLQAILRKLGLKVSGSKKELQERIRSHVNSLLRTPTKD